MRFERERGFRVAQYKRENGGRERVLEGEGEVWEGSSATEGHGVYMVCTA